MNALRQTFTLVGTIDVYATQTLVLAMSDTTAPERVGFLRVLVEALPSGSQIELDLLRVGGDAATENDWIKNVSQAIQTGIYQELSMPGWPGVRLRAKSAAVAGDAVVSAAWITKRSAGLE